METKERYDNWAQQQSGMPVYMMAWWLDAVCTGKDWDVLLVERDGSIIAAMPYLIRERATLRWIAMPQQTQIGGVWIDESTPINHKNVAYIAEHVKRHIDKLGLDYYYQHYPIGSPIPEALEGLGFKVSRRVTYRIEDVSDTNNVVARFTRDKRRQVKKAANLCVDFGMTAEALYDFHQRCLSENGKTISYGREFLTNLHSQATAKGRCQIIRIHNNEGTTLAACMAVWDNKTLYYLIQTHDSKMAETHASDRLVMESILLSQSKGLSFDFEGSMITGVATYYSRFGSTATEYYGVERHYSPWFKIVNWVYQLVNRRKK